MVRDYWQAFALFAIPIGGGIPAGVLLAHSRGIPWPAMEVLYFLSDVALAMVFEPVMLLVLYWGRRSAAVTRFLSKLKIAIAKTTPRYGHPLGPLTLIAIAFGSDPMTGRASTRAAGHSFLSGWALAITGDMLYFTLILVSTLWLSRILGDGTVATFVILALMLVVPPLIRRARERFGVTQ